MFNISTIKLIIKNIIYLVSGNALTLIIGFFFNIYIAKTLGTSEYGVFNTVEAFTALFGFLIFDGYQRVAVREACKNQETLRQVIENILGIKTLFSLGAVFAVFCSTAFFNYTDTITLYIYIFSFNLLFGSISIMLEVVYHSHSEMKYIAYTKLCHKLVYILPSGVIIWFGGGVEYLIICFTLSTFINIFINLYIVKRVFSIEFSLKSILSSTFNASFFRQALVFSLLGFIGYFHRTIDITMLSWMTSSSEVGLYAAASKLIMPVHLIGKMAKVAFFPQFVETFTAKKQVKAIELFKISGIIGILILPVSILISTYSDQIILYTFGTDFSGSVDILRYLAWIIPFGLLPLPFVLAGTANHHEQKMLLPNILRSSCNVILNYVLIKKYGYMGAVYSTMGTYLWFQTFIIGYLYYILKKAGNIT